MIETKEGPVGPNGLNRLTWALRRTELAVQALKERRLRSVGMPVSHYALLITVHHQPGLTGAELARRLNVSPQAVASLVARLEGRGQLERHEHPRHRHIQELHLTEAGHEALRAADAVIAEIERQITDVLGAASTEQLHKLLDEVSGAVRES